MTTLLSRQAVCPHCDAINRLPAERPALAGKCGKCGSRLFSGEPVVLTGGNVHRHLTASDVPLLVDFWAPWCGPCRLMAPVFAEAAARLEPEVRLAKIDTEAEPALGQQFGIRSIPTLILFDKGQEVARTSGAMPLNALLRWVQDRV